VTPISTATNTPGTPIHVGGSLSSGSGQIVITPGGKTAYVLTGSGVTPFNTATGTPRQADPRRRRAVPGDCDPAMTCTGPGHGTPTAVSVRRCWAAAWPASSRAAAHRRGAITATRSAPHPPAAVPPSRSPVAAPARARRAVLPRRASLTPRKDHNQGRTSSLRCGRLHLDSDLPRQEPAPAGPDSPSRAGHMHQVTLMAGMEYRLSQCPSFTLKRPSARLLGRASVHCDFASKRNPRLRKRCVRG